MKLEDCVSKIDESFLDIINSKEYREHIENTYREKIIMQHQAWEAAKNIILTD